MTLSVFSIATWAFFAIAVLLGTLVTLVRHPFVRLYRSMLSAFSIASLVMALGSFIFPRVVGLWNPRDTRLTPISDLPRTAWIQRGNEPEAPLQNPNVLSEIHSNEQWRRVSTAALRGNVEVTSRYVLTFQEDGIVRGLDLYNQGNPLFQIAVGSVDIQKIVNGKQKTYFLDSDENGYRVNVLDLSSPSIVWQRTFPRDDWASFSLDAIEQQIVVTQISHGVSALNARNGALKWKRPDLLSLDSVLNQGLWVLGSTPPKVELHLFQLKPDSGQTLQTLPIDLQKINYREYFPEQELWIVGQNAHAEQNFNQQFYALDLRNGKLSWAVQHQPAEDEIQDDILFLRNLDQERFLILYRSGKLEARLFKNGEISWQKRFSGFSGEWAKWVRIGNLNRLFLPDDQGAISVFSSEGEWQASFRLSEATFAPNSIGEWIVFHSQNFVSAYKHVAGSPITTTDP